MVDTAACEAKTRSRETQGTADTGCAAMTRSRETRATDEQWLLSTLNLETQVCEQPKVRAAAFIAVRQRCRLMEAWCLTRFVGT
jgi:hypothetical protein